MRSIRESLLAIDLLPQGWCSRRANQRVCFPPQWFHFSIVTAPIGSLKLTSIPVARLHRWQRMVLSEARGLRLFFGFPRGVGLRLRLGARRQKRSTHNVTGYSPSNPSVSKSPTRYPSEMILGMEATPLPKTLKLLVVLNGWRRSVPPSSKRST